MLFTQSETQQLNKKQSLRSHIKSNSYMPIKGVTVCTLLAYFGILVAKMQLIANKSDDSVMGIQQAKNKYKGVLQASEEPRKIKVMPCLSGSLVGTKDEKALERSDKQWENCIFSFTKMQQIHRTDKFDKQLEIADEVAASPIPLNIQQVVQQGKSKPKLRTMQLIVISNESAHNAICSVSNSIVILNQLTVETINNFLSAGVRKGIIIVDAEEHLIDFYLQNSLKGYKVQQMSVTVDSDYRFIRETVKQCERIVYVQSYFEISTEAATKLFSHALKVEPLSLFYTSSAYIGKGSGVKLKQLKDLNNTDLQNGLHPQQVNEYVFVFDARFLDIVTPLNFAYFNRYTVEELLVYPILALLQRSSQLQKLKETVHSLPQSRVQFVEFELNQTIIDKQSICFLSLPNNPFRHSASDLSEYLSTLNNPTNSPVSLIVYTPYNFSSLAAANSLWSTTKQLFNFTKFQNIRLRIRANKTVVSLGAYESAHTYCPMRSIMVSSRQNIRFNPQFISVVEKSINEKNHYYFFNFNNDSQQKVTFPSLSFSPKWRKQAILTTTHLGPLQVYKSDLMKMVYLWVLKCDEIDFYESQAAITMPMTELISGNIRFSSPTDSPIFTVKPRNITNKELRQVENLKLYYVWKGEDVTPLSYNSLRNLHLRRFGKNQIPKIIHQAWIGQLKIIPFKIALAQTLKQHNPNYEYRLWRFENITRTNFPFTHSLVARTLLYQQQASNFMIAGAIDLLRYEMIYQYGGIYFDYKTEGRKSMDPFLKYDIMFSDPDYLQGYARARLQFVGNGALGGTRGNHYFNNVLTKIIFFDTIFHPYSLQLTKMTGGFRIRRGINNEQVLTVSVYFMQFASQETEGKILCQYQTTFTPNQQIFIIKKGEAGDMKVGLPCTIYEEAYFIYYTRLGGSWVVPKDQFLRGNK